MSSKGQKDTSNYKRTKHDIILKLQSALKSKFTFLNFLIFTKSKLFVRTTRQYFQLKLTFVAN